MSILNFSVNLSTYDKSGSCSPGCGSTNNPGLVNFRWNRSVNGIPADNVLSQSQTVAVSSSVTLFTGQAYTFFYFESDSQVTLLLNGSITVVINPVVINSSTFPGIFMCNSDITSVQVTNGSATNPADIFFAAVE